MAALQKGNSIYPFWGESISLITGLDPLGLQVTSEATYASPDKCHLYLLSITRN